ncbi:thiamine pyrophosphate-binding protein [Paracraurococcus lichenis]|uniref:Thiamine pyrophosphate-binding protein n=1 Tax=Paracraurococcus lichenis TaxID=3064888 RepID=A0ABT9DTL9_9PROT|nr:thiamine pyrophosphate-dependent enzyme [Paracraurococcus sp. LOR1-02]MDO9707223.1 thiamine pyrophosphate-binding protein [Paracraurococcus sp. LOR1-02]
MTAPPSGRDGLTGAEAVAEALRAAGVPRLYGVPGGGSSLDLVEAAAARGIPFVLARQETAAVIMAATEAELSGRPGAVVVTRGPGVGNAANGIAQAALDRAPLLLLADGFTGTERAFATHQFFDHAAMLAPVTKAQARATEPGGAPGAIAATLLATAMAAPRGPALLEVSGGVARAPAAPLPLAALAGAAAAPEGPALAAARRLLAAARRPVLVAGLEATEPAACAALRALAERLGCPGLVTYKAKGVLPDAHPLFGGVFTGGEAEAPLLREADLILLAGADPVEFIPQPWRYGAPVIDLGTAPRPLHYHAPAAALYGPLAPALAALAAEAAPSGWEAAAIAAQRAAWLRALANAPGGNRGLSPQAVVEITQQACRVAGRDPRVSVDAGAHMFPCTTFWQAERPGDLLISNGLATMGFALPAGIAAALHDPGRGALAFTGDGGLLMALGELATAAVLGAKLTIVVFNDASLSLIDIKKGGRALPDGALGWPEADFAGALRALGGTGLRAADEAGFRAALAEALAAPGPALVDVRVDPGSYPAQIKALRG